MVKITVKTFTILLIICISASFANFWCYQESANTSNQSGTDNCAGMDYTGLYTENTTPYFYGTFNDMIDGNWSSYAITDIGGEHLYINYSKPLQATNALWLIKWTAIPKIQNFSLSSCWNAYPNTISLDYYGYSTYAYNITCFNGSEWIDLANSTTDTKRLFEEAIWWDMNGSIDACSEITHPGNYILVTNLTGADDPPPGTPCMDITADNVELDCDGYTINASGVGVGVRALSKNNITIKNCIIKQFATGISISNAINDNLTNNTLISNGNGIYGFNINTSVVSNNNISNSLSDGVVFSISDGNNISNNNATENANGFYFTRLTQNIDLTNDIVSNNSKNGFIFEIESHNINITQCMATRNIGTGVYFIDAFDPEFVNNHTNIIMSGNNISNNANGTLCDYCHGFTGFSNNISSNTNYGFDIEYYSDNFSLANDHYYNNVGDFRVYSIGMVLNLTNITFDNPIGNYKNFTALSLYDVVATDDSYIIKWTSNSSELPANHQTFNQKFINITAGTGFESIDSITFTWLDTESSGYTEANLYLSKYDWAWTDLNSTPDTTGNTLSLFNLVPGSDYGILYYQEPAPPGGSGTPTPPSPPPESPPMPPPSPSLGEIISGGYGLGNPDQPVIGTVIADLLPGIVTESVSKCSVKKIGFLEMFTCEYAGLLGLIFLDFFSFALIILLFIIIAVVYFVERISKRKNLKHLPINLTSIVSAFMMGIITIIVISANNILIINLAKLVI